MSVYSEYLKAVGYLWVAIILLSYIVWQLFAVGSNVWLGEWGNDKKLNGTEERDQNIFRLEVYSYLGLGQGRNIVTYAVFRSLMPLKIKIKWDLYL